MKWLLSYIDGHNIGIRRNCLYLLLLAALITLFTSYNMMTELTHSKEDYKELQRQAFVASSYYQKELVNSSVRLATAHSRNLRDAISDKLQEDYGDNLEQLKIDLDNYYVVGDTENKVYRDFSDICYAYFDRWYGGSINVRIEIIGKTHVYFTSDPSDPLRYQRNLIQLFNMQQGQVALIDKVTGEIKVMKQDYIVDSVEDLSSIYVLTPAYIYDHQDIFGNLNTNPDGTQAENSTLAVIVAIQPLSAENLHRIKDFNEQLGKDQLEETSTIIARGLVNLVISGSLMVGLGIVYTVLRARQRKLEMRNGGGRESGK